MKSIKLSDEAYDRLEQQVWEAVVYDNRYVSLPAWADWWDEAYITTKGKLFVHITDDSGDTFGKTFSRKQLLVAYLNLENHTHCGGYHLVEEPDDCTADRILQHALFGKEKYA